MTESNADLLARSGPVRAAPGEVAGHPVEAERQRIGRLLHHTILQDLTVAGLHLKQLEDAAPEPTASAIRELSRWLRERQSELRRIVTELEQGQRGDGGTNLAAIAADLHDRYGCEVNVDPQLAPSRFEPEIWSAMVDIVQGVGRILAGDLSARCIDLVPVGTGQAALRLSHDGQRLADRSAQLAAVRTLVGRKGASLQLQTAGTAEQLTLDWTI